LIAAGIAASGLGAPLAAAPVLEQVSPTAVAYRFFDDFNTASFGATEFDITAAVFRLSGSDGVAGLSLGCAATDFGSGVSGSIVLLSRGSCNFSLKARNAQDAGALAILVANDQPLLTNAPALGGSDPAVAIAAFSLSYSLGTLLADQTATRSTVFRLALGDTAAPSSTPEPATWMNMLLGFGLAGTALRARRRPTVELA
jgi:hypothetical protein